MRNDPHAKRRPLIALCAAAAILGGAPAVNAAAVKEGGIEALQNRSIAYAMTFEEWGIYKTPGAKTECPNGFNDGPREQFKVLFPDNGTKRKLVDTQLAREAEIWFPTTKDDGFAFKEAQGAVGIGMNLDGKIGPKDFTSPTGEKGIDNQLYRAIGCVGSHRDVAALMIVKWRQDHKFNRVVIELTDVDSLANDDDVTVTTYRGLNPLLRDASGNDFMPGGTQDLDLRWGKEFIQKFHGKIVDGVLVTEGADWIMPRMALANISTLPFRDLRFQLKLTPDRAEGLMAGYVDIEGWNTERNESISTHHQSYGQESAPSLYRAMLRLADGYPDPKTGRNTALSSSLVVRFTQVFIQRPPQETASQAVRAPGRDARH
jgi:hypothetical protein